MITLLSPALLAEIMAQRDMTGARLGRAVGVSRQTISYLVSGRRPTTSWSTACSIEKELNVPPGTLFDITTKASTKASDAA